MTDFSGAQPETEPSHIAEATSPSVQLHDPYSADYRTASQMSREVIRVSGAEDIHLFLRTDNADYDRVWEEDPDPTYWNSFSIKGFVKPQQLEVGMTKFGPDSINKADFTFSLAELRERVGDRLLRPGDAIKAPHNALVGIKTFIVKNASPNGNFRYQWLYFTCNCETITADVTVSPLPDDAELPEVSRGQFYEQGS